MSLRYGEQPGVVVRAAVRTDVPLVSERGEEHVVGHREEPRGPPIWLACSLIAARFAPTNARTSTTVVIRSVGTPISSSSSRAASASSWKTPEYFLISSTRWSRSAVASYMRD